MNRSIFSTMGKNISKAASAGVLICALQGLPSAAQAAPGDVYTHEYNSLNQNGKTYVVEISQTSNVEYRVQMYSLESSGSEIPDEYLTESTWHWTASKTKDVNANGTATANPVAGQWSFDAASQQAVFRASSPLATDEILHVSVSTEAVFPNDKTVWVVGQYDDCCPIEITKMRAVIQAFTGCAID